MRFTNGVGVFAQACELGGYFEQLLWHCDNIQPYVSVFVKCDTIFRFFFRKLPQIRTSKFRKGVKQHIKGMVGSIIWLLLEIHFCFQQWKNFENPLRPVYSDTTQLNSTRQREQQLTQFVGRNVTNKNTTDLAVRCSTGSVEFSWVVLL